MALVFEHEIRAPLVPEVWRSLLQMGILFFPTCVASISPAVSVGPYRARIMCVPRLPSNGESSRSQLVMREIRVLLVSNVLAAAHSRRDGERVDGRQEVPSNSQAVEIHPALGDARHGRCARYLHRDALDMVTQASSRVHHHDLDPSPLSPAQGMGPPGRHPLWGVLDNQVTGPASAEGHGRSAVLRHRIAKETLERTRSGGPKERC